VLLRNNENKIESKFSQKMIFMSIAFSHELFSTKFSLEVFFFRNEYRFQVFLFLRNNLEKFLKIFFFVEKIFLEKKSDEKIFHFENLIKLIFF